MGQILIDLHVQFLPCLQLTELSPGAVSSTPVQQNVTGTSATISGLQFAQSYVFAIAAVSSSGVSALSSQAEVTIAPAAPTGLKVTASGAGSLGLTWMASSGAGDYNIFQATTSGAEGTKCALSDWASTSTTFSGLTPGQQYFFTLVAVGLGGSSTPSAQASGTVVPAAPTGLTAIAGNGSVSLTWAAAAGAAVRWIGTLWRCSPSWLAFEKSGLYRCELCQHVNPWAMSAGWTNEPHYVPADAIKPKCRRIMRTRFSGVRALVAGYNPAPVNRHKEENNESKDVPAVARRALRGIHRPGGVDPGAR